MKKPQIDAEKKKKWDNFWYYYKYHVLAGAFILFCIIIFVKDMRGKVSYYYTVAFLGEYGIAQEDSTKLQKWFEEHAEVKQGRAIADCRYNVHLMTAKPLTPRWLWPVRRS